MLTGIFEGIGDVKICDDYFDRKANILTDKVVHKS